MALDLPPDGRWVAFDLLGHIYRVPASGGAAECLIVDSGVAINNTPSYSPTGKRSPSFPTARVRTESTSTSTPPSNRPFPSDTPTPRSGASRSGG
jgi:hypothetical protein